MEMLAMTEYKNVQWSHPIDYVRKYCETGYFLPLLDELLKLCPGSEYLFYVDFRWHRDKSSVKLPETNKKVILFIIVDESGFLPAEVPAKVFAVFKTMAKPENLTYPNVFHIPQGPNLQIATQPVQDVQSRKYSVFFSGNLHTGRERLYKHFSNGHIFPFPVLHRIASILGRTFDKRYSNGYIRFTQRFRAGLSATEYSDVLYDTKVALCPPGVVNPESMRHFEAMRAGCIVVSEDSLPDVYCYKGAPFIKVKKWKELDGIMKDLLSSPQKMEEQQRLVLEWWDSHCSEKAMARYMADCIKEIENGTAAGQ